MIGDGLPGGQVTDGLVPRSVQQPPIREPGEQLPGGRLLAQREQPRQGVPQVLAVHGGPIEFDRLPFANRIDTQQIYSTSQLLSRTIGFGVQPNKAIVGRNAFAHEAGIHQHGVISNPLCYEIMTPESVGVTSNELVLGKHSGRHALALRYEELGYVLETNELDAAYRSFTELADRKKCIYDQDLISLITTESALSAAA